MDTKKIILLVGALLVAGISAFAVRALLGSGSGPVAVASPIVQQSEGPKVLVAQAMLPLGTIITAEHLSYQPWPNDLVQDAYYLETESDIQALTGKVVRVSIARGQPIAKRALIGPGERGFLAAALQPGQRAVTVPINNISGVAGFIFPGDRVDLVMNANVEAKNEDGEVEYTYNVAETLVRNVRVLAVDQRTNDVGDGGPQTGRSVTFEVPPKMVEKIAVAQTLGELSLSLRSIAENRAQLEQAIASGRIDVGDDQTLSEDAAMEFAARQLPDDSGSTYTVGNEVSRFAVSERGPKHFAKKQEDTGPPPPSVRVTRGMNVQNVVIPTPNGSVSVPSAVAAAALAENARVDAAARETRNRDGGRISGAGSQGGL